MNDSVGDGSFYLSSFRFIFHRKRRNVLFVWSYELSYNATLLITFCPVLMRFYSIIV